MRRFYKAARLGPDRSILLDDRPVRTPRRAPLMLPTGALAQAVVAEWANQAETIDPQSMPCTGLANAAIDHVSPDPARFAASLSSFGETELLCYRAADPPPLVARQEAVWTPLLDWARQRYDVSFHLVEGIMHQPQPAATLARLGRVVAELDAFRLAAMSPLVTISGSLVIALAVFEGHVEPEPAFDAAHLDELWQVEQWGEDHFALETRAHHRNEFMAASRFLRLL
jgi:chaperone required for assembly of F1-ATPase